MKHTIRNILRLTLVCLMILALCVGMLGCSKNSDDETEPSTTNADASTDPSEEEADFMPVGTGDPSSAAAKASYATTSATPGDADMKKEVIHFDGGSLTNGELNIYFWTEFYNFLNSEWGSYAAYMGLDTNKALNLQAAMTPIDENDENSESMSWEQYFLQSAMTSYAFYKGLELAAEEEGFVLPESYQESLDTLPSTVESNAADNGLSSPDEFIQLSFGSGTTLEDYMSYMKTYTTAYAYFQEVLTPQCVPTDEEIEAYFDQNAESYAESGITKSDTPNVNVRHILVRPADSYTVDTDGDGTNDGYTDEEWAAAEEEANRIYALWQEDPTEENFGTLAKEYTADSNGEAGGLYEDVYPGQMVEEFNDWCFDASREVGDNGIVKTTYGYHIMYFSGKTENYHWYDTAKADLTNKQLSELSEHVAGQYTFTYDCLDMVICDVVTASVTVPTTE